MAPRGLLCSCLSALTFGTVVLAAGYPASFPFENEVIYIADMVESTPDFTFEDATDPGGYAWVSHWKMNLLGGDLTDDNFPFVWQDSGCYAWILVKVYGAPPVMPRDTWNCSARGTYLTDADYTGVVDAKTICSVGQCCKGYVGLPEYGDDQMTWHSWANDRSAAAMCGDFPHEDLYCISVSGHMHVNCYEIVLSPTERALIFPCWDSFLYYWNSCPVFRNVYTPNFSLGLAEPRSYTDPMSPSEMMTWDGSFLYPDRVCNPYSYYHPDMGKDQGAEPVFMPVDEVSTSSVLSWFAAAAIASFYV